MKTDNGSGRQRPAHIDPVLQTISRILHILLRPSSQRFTLPCRKLPNHFRRTPQHHTARRHHHPLRHQRIRSNDRLCTDQCPIQNRCAHSNQAFILHRARMHNCGMPHRHVSPENAWKTVRQMQHRIVLHIRILTHHNPVNIPPQHRVVPNTRMRTERHIAQHHRGARDINIRAERRFLPQESIQLMCEVRHDPSVANGACEIQIQANKKPACVTCGLWPIGSSPGLTSMAKRNVKSERRPMMMMPVMMVVMMKIRPRRNENRCRINHRCRLINDRRRLVNHRLLHHHLSNHRSGLRINNGRLLHDHLPNDRCGLHVGRRSGIDINYLIPCLHARDQSSHGQRCDCD